MSMSFNYSSWIHVLSEDMRQLKLAVQKHACENIYDFIEKVLSICKW